MKRLLWWKWIGLGALCAVIGVVGAAEYLNFTDFCYGDRRYISDAELIDAAIAHEISHVPAIRSQNAVTYASVAAFHDANPNCCRLVRQGNPVFEHVLHIRPGRVIGIYSLIVDLWYRSQESGPMPFLSNRYLLDSCGRIHEVRDPVGWPSDKAATREWAETGEPPPHYPHAGDIVRNCAGRRIEFALPATTLYVDPNLLDSFTLYDLFHWVSGPFCPTWPVKMTRIGLSGATLNAMDIRTGLGRQSIRLGVGGAPKRDTSPDQAQDSAALSNQEPWVELKPKLEFEYKHPGLRNARNYILHFPGAPVGSDTRVEVGCNGSPGGRECSVYPRGHDAFADLAIHYFVSQTQLPIADSASSDPTTEPGALLQFETRLRTLIGELEQRP